jgi:hypothetical protein
MTAFLEINGTAYQLLPGDGSPDSDNRIADDAEKRLAGWVSDGAPVGRIPTVAPGGGHADLLVKPSQVATFRAYVN